MNQVYIPPVVNVVHFDTRSTTVLGNCTYWKGGCS